MAKTDWNIIKTAKHTSILSFFISGSTLICCALPAMLVAIGSAATLISLVGVFPQFVWISEHKMAVFGLAALMLVLAGYLQWQARNAPCPVEPRLAEVCLKTRKNALIIYWVSVTIYMLGAFFAFIAPLFI